MGFGDFELVIKVIGWVLAIGPFAAVIGVSVYLIAGVSKEDETVKGLVSMGTILFILGVIILAMSYLTDIFKHA